MSLRVMVGVEKKKMSVVKIVEDKDPPSILPVMQPVVYKFEYVGFWAPAARNLNPVCNISKALLKTGSVACVDPENPRPRRSLSGSVHIFDGKL
jgi:hypothetical protein